MTTLGKWETNNVYCCDALELLRGMPDGCVDITVTSPPYNIDWHGHGKSSTHKNLSWLKQFENGYDNYYDAMPEPEYQAWVASIIRECLRVSKGLVWVNHKIRFRDGAGIHPLSFLPFPVWSEVIWDRGGSLAFNNKRFANSHEHLYGFGRPHFWNDESCKLLSVWRIVPINKDDGHPCPYPESLVERLITASCPSNGIVFDPFMGSGTTAVVAQRMGRNWIGSEISPKYIELVNKRLAAPFTLPLFADTLP